MPILYFKGNIFWSPSNFKFIERSIYFQYQGTWYEIQKLPTEAEKNGKCASAEYILEGDIVKVTNRHVVGNVQAIVTGTARFAPDANNAGKLLVALNFGGKILEKATLSL